MEVVLCQACERLSGRLGAAPVREQSDDDGDSSEGDTVHGRRAARRERRDARRARRARRARGEVYELYITACV